MSPLILEPFLRPQVWGGSRLRQDFRKDASAAATIGESWEISGHPLHVSRVAEGPLASVSLNDLWLRHRHEWCPVPALAKLPRFPLLVKLLDCGEASSVQVHPNNEQAAATRSRRNGQDRGVVCPRSRTGESSLHRTIAGRHGDGTAQSPRRGHGCRHLARRHATSGGCVSDRRGSPPCDQCRAGPV